MHSQITITLPAGSNILGVAKSTKPDYPGPHSFIILAVVVTTICGVLNLLSFACGVPAIILAVLVSINCKV